MHLDDATGGATPVLADKGEEGRRGAAQPSHQARLTEPIKTIKVSCLRRWMQLGGYFWAYVRLGFATRRD